MFRHACHILLWHSILKAEIQHVQSELHFEQNCQMIRDLVEGFAVPGVYTDSRLHDTGFDTLEARKRYPLDMA